MSIVEQALRKLEQNERQTQQAPGDLMTAAPVAMPPAASRTTPLLAGGVLVALAFIGWHYLPGAVRSASSAIGEYRSEWTGSAPAAPAAATAAAAPQAAPVTHTPAAAVPVAAAAVAAVAVANAAAPTAAPSVHTVAATVVPPAVPAAPAPAVSAADRPAPSANVAALAPVVARPAAVPAEKSAAPGLSWTSAAWIRKGAAVLGQKDGANSVRLWAAGLEQLPPNSPLVVLPHSKSRAAAMSLYRSLADRYPAIVVPEGPATAPSWVVMVVPERRELPELLADLRGTLKRNSLGDTTVAAWRQAGEPRNVQVARVAAPAAAPFEVAAPPAPEPARQLAADEADPSRSAQGSASSSPEAILRRFTDVERLVARGQFQPALDAVVQVEADVGETWQTRYLAGSAARGLRRWDEAINALTRAHQLNPASVKVLLDRAICLQEVGNHSAALEDLHKAGVLNPAMPELVLNAGYSFDALGRREDALREYQKYLEMTSSREEYAKVRAWVAKRVAQ